MKLIVKKGSNYSVWWNMLPFIHLFKTRFTGTYCFTKESLYEVPWKDRFDWNKLFGVHHGGIHENSARFGWRQKWQTNRFELGSYCYVNGKRIDKVLFEVGINEPFNIEITLMQNSVLFWKDTHVLDEVEGLALNFPVLYKTGFYFGGNNPAPHDIVVKKM